MNARLPIQGVRTGLSPSSLTPVMPDLRQHTCQCGTHASVPCAECNPPKNRLSRTAVGHSDASEMSSLVQDPKSRKPLNIASRAFIEPRFGHVFSKVGLRDTVPARTLQRAPGDEAPSPHKEERTEPKPAGAEAETKSVAPCDPKGLSRADYLKEPGTSTDDFGLTTLSGTVSVPVVHVSRTRRGFVLDPTGAELPPLTSVFTAAGNFIEDTIISIGDNTECPSGRKYPLQWRILPGGAQKIREGELEHCADFQHAFDISLRRYAEVVNELAAKKVVFASQRAAEHHATRLVGPRPDTWSDVFACLAKKTKIRDNAKWHTPHPLTRPPRLEDDCKFARAYVTGLPEVGKHPSAEIIKDCGEGPPIKGKSTAVSTGTKTKSAPAPKVEGKVERPRMSTLGVPPIVHEVLRSPGQPLDSDARGFFESRFGHDFGLVRIHTDTKAMESAQAVNALAYTVGRDVVLGSGYRPGTTAGRRVLAHELAHVVQQAFSTARETPEGIEIGSPEDSAEREAEHAAHDLDRLSAPRSGQSQLCLRRQSSTDEQPKKEPPPVIPLPHPFDRLDIKPIIPGPIGAPSLEDLNKAWWFLHGQSKGTPGNVGCAPGWEMRSSGPAEGLCCPPSSADPDRCCPPYRLTSLGRCCSSGEYAQGFECVKFTTLEIKVPDGGKGAGLPTAPPAGPFIHAPRRGLGLTSPLTISMDIYFKQNRPSAVVSGESALRESLTASGAAIFSSIVEWLKRGPQFSVQLTGKASIEGRPTHNLELGDYRARSVAAALTSEGIGVDRIADPPGLPAPCTRLEDGIHNCGDLLSSKTIDERDRQVRATLFISSQ